jgi:hypothetical protein
MRCAEDESFDWNLDCAYNDEEDEDIVGEKLTRRLLLEKLFHSYFEQVSPLIQWSPNSDTWKVIFILKLKIKLINWKGKDNV